MKKQEKKTLKIKLNQTKTPNKMHLEVQTTTKANVFKPKKGKGSFKRRQISNNHEESK